MFKWFRKNEERVYQPPGAGRPCPRCLRPLKTAELEWRCVEACPHERVLDRGERPRSRAEAWISEPREQSWPCPDTQCRKTLTCPHPKDCPYPYVRPIRLPLQREHRLLSVALDGRPAQATHGWAAHLFALRLAQCPGGTQPQPETRDLEQRWNDRLLVHRGRLPGTRLTEPMAARLPARRPDLWDVFVYFYGFAVDSLEGLTEPFTADDCRRPPLSRTEAVGQVDLVSIPMDAASLLDDARRQRLAEGAEWLSRALRRSPGITYPELFLLVTEQSELFRRLGAAHGPELFAHLDAGRRDSVLAGYVLDSLRGRELLAPLIALPWRRLRCGLAGAPFTESSSVAGLGSWAEDLLEKADV